MKKCAVLCGGGALSAYQVGVLSKLPMFDRLYGVSGGALAAVAYSYLGPQGAIDLYKSIKGRKDIFGYNILNLITRGSLYNHKPLMKLMRRVIASGEPRCEVVVGATDLETGGMCHWPNIYHTDQRFAAMATASACIPGLVEPVGGVSDGGIMDNVPLRQAIDDGCTDITLILTENPNEPLPLVNAEKLGVIGVLLRSFEILRHDAFRADIGVCLHKNGIEHYEKVKLAMYALSLPGFESLDFTQKTIAPLIDIGRQDKPQELNWS